MKVSTGRSDLALAESAFDGLLLGGMLALGLAARLTCWHGGDYPSSANCGQSCLILCEASSLMRSSALSPMNST